jgi:hypothetical protein
MKKLIIICVMTDLIFAVSTPVANGCISYGTPTDTGLEGSNLTPFSFVNFDDKGTGIQALLNDYGSFGVTSITEIRGAGALFARYGFNSQNRANLAGTGFHINGRTPWKRDDTIRIDLEPFANMVGMVTSNNTEDPEFLNLFDSVYSLLKSTQTGTRTNVYNAINRGIHGILHLNNRDFFTRDYSQSFAIPAPGAIMLGSIGVGLVGWLRRFRTI